MMGNIYISSLTMTGMPVEEIIKVAKNNDFALEFSSGIPYRDDIEKLYQEAEIKKIPHNYFPAPRVPFVLNLASSNAGIRNQSIEHCKKGLYLSKQAGAPFFSAHAGFCIDPDPLELGKKINYSSVFDRELHKQFFLQSLDIILKDAEHFDIQFLIENNVIAPFNIVDGKNPLLCCETTEIEWLFKEVNNERLGLLLDTAHLKVSCETLGLDRNDEIIALTPYIKAIHHSDNNGLIDNNEQMDVDYWFLPHLNKFNKLIQVIEVKNISMDIIKEQIKLLQIHGC